MSGPTVKMSKTILSLMVAIPGFIASSAWAEVSFDARMQAFESMFSTYNSARAIVGWCESFKGLRHDPRRIGKDHLARNRPVLEKLASRIDGSNRAMIAELERKHGAHDPRLSELTRMRTSVLEQAERRARAQMQSAQDAHYTAELCDDRLPRIAAGEIDLERRHAAEIRRLLAP